MYEYFCHFLWRIAQQSSRGHFCQLWSSHTFWLVYSQLYRPNIVSHSLVNALGNSVMPPPRRGHQRRQRNKIVGWEEWQQMHLQKYSDGLEWSCCCRICWLVRDAPEVEEELPIGVNVSHAHAVGEVRGVCLFLFFVCVICCLLFVVCCAEKKI